MRTLDLNCDMGESFGAWTMGNDDAVLAYVSSANIACGFHAGDPRTMRRTVARALAGFARAAGGSLRFVKPHGALYNMAARDRGLAAAIVAAVADFDRSLAFYGLAGSELLHAAEAAGLLAVSEVFADRGYLDAHRGPRARRRAGAVDGAGRQGPRGLRARGAGASRHPLPPRRPSRRAGTGRADPQRAGRSRGGGRGDRALSRTGSTGRRATPRAGVAVARGPL